MSKQFWTEAIAWSTATATAVANTTTETVLVPNLIIPANYMQDGRGVHIWGSGSYGTTSTPTVIFQVRWGGVAGTVLAKSSTVTTTSAVGGGASMTALFTYDFTIQTRSNGSSGTVMTNGQLILYNSTAATSGTVTNYGLAMPLVSGSTGGTTPATATVDWTADTALSFTITWGTANAANSIQDIQHYTSSLN
jgi:hypothetical protein